MFSVAARIQWAGLLRFTMNTDTAREAEDIMTRVMMRDLEVGMNRIVDCSFVAAEQINDDAQAAAEHAGSDVLAV
ncbi:MAG TPA: hypothetical protein VH855_30520 [Acetobacteraceae bacterium]|jgi:hypothetical protein